MSNSKKILILLLPTIFIFGIGIFLFTNNESHQEEKAVEEYIPPESNPEIIEEYDVIVIGGEPEGVAAAVSAARNGANTLLIEKRDGLGGLLTYGMLNYIDMVYGIEGEHAIGGIFEEWHHLVGRDDAFDIELGKSAFLKLVEDEENLTLLLETETQEAIVNEHSQVTGVKIENENGNQKVAGKRFIDATQDADFAVMAGAPYFTGGGDINLEDRRMAVTLMIHLKNVDWEGVRQTAEEEIFDYAGMTDTVAWGFNDIHYVYEPVEENTRLRGLNLVRVKNKDGDEEFFINALQLFDVDGIDESAVENAIEKGTRETDHVLKFLQDEFPGFENAEILSYPEELYVRETRHVYSEYMLPMSDIWTHADHWDSVGYGGYPVDVQATSINDYGYVLSDPEQYAIPFRSLVPLEIENLAVASRSAGYSSLAAGSARIVPTGMAAAEGAGLAAQLSIENEITFRELSQNEELIEELRSGLLDQNAKVESFDIAYPYEHEYFDESIQFLLDYGLLVGGYDNELNVEEDFIRGQLLNLLSNGIRRINDDLYEEYNEQLRSPFEGDNTYAEGVFTRNEIAEYLVDVFSDESTSNGESAWEQALNLQLIDDEIYHRLSEDKELTRAEGFYIAANILRGFE